MKNPFSQSIALALLTTVCSLNAETFSRSSTTSWDAATAAGAARTGNPNWGTNPVWTDAWSYKQLKFTTSQTWTDATVSNTRWTGTEFANTVEANPWIFATWTQVGKINQTTLDSRVENTQPTYMSTDTFYAPGAMWTNTTAEAVTASCAGDLIFTWTRGDNAAGFYNHSINAALLKYSDATITILQDLTQAKPTNTWNVESKTITLSGDYTIAPGESLILVVRGWAGESNYLARLNDSAMTITTAPATLSNYSSWIDDYYPLNDPKSGEQADPDGDGVANVFEFINGSLPNDLASVFPIAVSPPTGGTVEFSYRRTLASQSMLPEFQTSTTLLSWITAVHGENDVVITTSSIDANTDLITVKLPASNACFGRLMVPQS